MVSYVAYVLNGSLSTPRAGRYRNASNIANRLLLLSRRHFIEIKLARLYNPRAAIPLRLSVEAGSIHQFTEMNELASN